MAYPAKNTNGYTSPSKNSASSTLPSQSWQRFLDIGEGFLLLIDSDNYLVINQSGAGWSYQSKS